MEQPQDTGLMKGLTVPHSDVPRKKVSDAAWALSWGRKDGGRPCALCRTHEGRGA